MVSSTRANGFRGRKSDRARGNKYSSMDHYMKVGSRLIELRVEAALFMLMVTSMRDSGLMTWPMDSESTLMQMEPATKDSGSQIGSTVKVANSGQMAPIM